MTFFVFVFLFLPSEAPILSLISFLEHTLYLRTHFCEHLTLFPSLWCIPTGVAIRQAWHRFLMEIDGSREKRAVTETTRDETSAAVCYPDSKN
jgi:hypothetical protein